MITDQNSCEEAELAIRGKCLVLDYKMIKSKYWKAKDILQELKKIFFKWTQIVL